METQNNNVFIRLENVTKAFGSKIVANKDVNMEINRGEILALLGENGSGKTTLMNMLAGIYFPDAGTIYVNEQPVSITSPKDAYDLGIGMIHQHFKLVDVFTSMENIVLGIKSSIPFKNKISNLIHHNKEIDRASIRDAREIVKGICTRYGFKLDLDKKVYDMSVSEKQTLEIVKAVYRGAELLILDEPTAVLTPVETEHLFDVLRNMKNDGKSIIIITHKLNEVMEISDRVAVLRKGESIGSVMTSATNENELTEMMVGKKVELNIERSEPVDPKDRLIVRDLNCKNEDGVSILSNVSFTARSGEILGIAGISGSGQKEILESIAGLVKDQGGSITYIDPNDGAINLRDRTPAQIRDLGVRLSFVPEDRLGMGLVGNMDLVDNMMLRSYSKGKGTSVNRHQPKELADEIVRELEVKTPSVSTPVRKLSGGNVQKILVGREISLAPKVLMVAYPVRGLDINSSYMIYNLLNEQKKNGVCVIYVGEDLDVLIALSDRIVVLGDGKVNGIVDARKTNKFEVGKMMTKEISTEVN
jgi:general nucleoside transport system ATP-binding protein